METEQELLSPENNYSEMKLPTPPRTTKESLYIILLIIGFVLTLVGFWQSERLLWNRIPYATGSGWGNRSPIFRVSLYTVEEMQGMINTYFALYLIGNILIGGFAIFLYTDILRNIWTDKTKKLTGAFSIISGIIWIFGFWMFQSIKFIGQLPAIDEENQSGSEWIYGDLENISSKISNIGRIFQFIFLAFFILSLVMLILKRERKKDEYGLSFFQKTWDFIKGLGLNFPFYVILIMYLIFTLFPVYLAIKISISTVGEINTQSAPAKALQSLIINYSSVLFAESQDEAAFFTSFFYSAIIGLGTGILGLSIAVSAAYALARFDFTGNKLMTYMILATQMFPGMILLIPQYVIWTTLGLTYNSDAPNVVIFGVLLASATGATAYCTWMMKGYFETVPIDIEEAAIIDGASRLRIFLKIALPLVKSGIVAVLLFTLISSWQDFVLARTFIGQGKTQSTLPLLFYNYQNSSAPDIPTFFELVAPYSILVALPIVIVFMLMQKSLASGAVAGGIK